ncbi:ATP-binding protein [Polaribacter sp. MSW13]|uniref:ATP-binding protein n=1 Tax=Polaribacter marinus TaxID=2916838 RepID=A0A9X1VRU6_9FLAO|nr:BREX system ATP-binding domain-containing protein [Polaribacter marinus]MCI2229912.1 ATP-binding protein [Polaribacter marinus]
MSIDINKIFNKRANQSDQERFEKFDLTSNPFPKSGTANINESSDQTRLLIPIDDEVHMQIINYVKDSLFSTQEEDQKLIGTITGDYGTGKTQLLLYAKYLIQNQDKKAFVIYINNPGTKLSELIGSIIEKIGQEQFKKYLWNQVIDEIKKDSNDYKNSLLSYLSDKQGQMFGSDNDPFSVENESNHKAFLDAFLNQINNRTKRTEFNQTLKSIILRIFEKENSNDPVISDYFYNLISEDFGVNKTWETITTGSGKYLDNKVVKLLNAIINIIQNQGFERFYLLVDEFEDITSGRLTKKESDSYAYNLRALIDKERRWCLLIALTRTALDDIKKTSPPLVDRLTDRQINIERLSNTQTKQIILNYLNLSREPSENIFPFSDEAIDFLNKASEELPRLVLRKLYFIMERAADELNDNDEISAEFVEKYFEN